MCLCMFACHRLLFRPFYNLSTVSLRFIMSGNKAMQHAQNLKFQRVKMREKSMKYAPGIVNLQVLGSGCKGAPKSLYLFTDQSRYLFNCGEGTQRLAHEHKMRLAKLDSIFITQPVWENLGGLPGLALTIQDVGVPQVTLHGPEGLGEIFVGTKRFVVLKNLSVITKQCKAYDKYEDHILTVTYVPLEASLESFENSCDTPSPVIESEDDDIDYYDYEGNQNPPIGQASKKRRHESPPRQNGDSPDSPSKRVCAPVRRGLQCMSYICQLKPRPGTLSLQKCVAHNVPPGPLLGQLKGGKDITLADGTLVRSADVTEPDEVGAVFIILDCPTEDYLDHLMSETIFTKHQSSASNEDDVAAVVAHFSPPHVMSDPRYKEFISRFPSTTQHLVLNETNDCQGLVAVHKIQCKLHMLHPVIFPMLCDSGIPVLDKSNSSISQPSQEEEDAITPDMKPLLEEIAAELTSHYTGLPSNSISQSKDPALIPARTLMKVPLRPRLPLDTSQQLSLDIHQYTHETLSAPNFPTALSELKHLLSQCEEKEELGGQQYPEVTFLGTGSSIPNKTRNTSSILLRIDSTSCMLLDCGEGTHAQLVRLFGPREVDILLSQLNAIYISHLHADHHLGLISLVKARAKVAPARSKLVLLAPKQIVTWLNFYSARFEKIGHLYELVPLSLFEQHGQNRPQLSAETETLLSSLGLDTMTTCLVRHCPNAFGVALTTKSGHKVTYSGDTMPCDSLVSIGKNSHLLIHEATHEDELEKEAQLKMHSTVSQALVIGQRMRAQHVLLTHFSQRYAKLPRLNKEFTDNVGIAFDNMRISLSNLTKLKLFYPCLKLMFANDQEEIEHRALKRTLKAEVRRKASLENQVQS